MVVTQEDVLTALKDCYDPEIPVNIVDLGSPRDPLANPRHAGRGSNHDYDLAGVPFTRDDWRSGQRPGPQDARGKRCESGSCMDAAVDAGAAESSRQETTRH